MRVILAGIVSSCLVLQVLGNSLEKIRYEYQFGMCEKVKAGLNMPKVHDGVAPKNEACSSSDLCGSSRCCVTVGTCKKVPGGKARWVRVDNSLENYEGGCFPKSVNSSLPEYNPACKQVGECNVAYLYAAGNGYPKAGVMTELPRATMDRLMAGSNKWCSHTQRCQDEPCSPPPDFLSCTGVRSGINLKKVHDGLPPLNEPCHSRNHCEGGINCCATVGTCKAAEGERGVFVHSKKAYYEGGCSPNSLDKDDEDYDPECTQVGECHHAYIVQTRNSTAKPGLMTPIPNGIMNRLMQGSSWNPALQNCIGNAGGEGSAGDASSSSSKLQVALAFMSLMVTL